MLKPDFGGEYIHGLPTTNFEEALLWLSAATLCRRKALDRADSFFPSWSWAGWAGNVTFPRCNSGTLPRICWLKRPGNTPKTRNFRDIDDASLGHQQTANIGNALFSNLDASQDQERPNPDYLTFNTLTATLQMEPGRRHISLLKTRNRMHLSAEICSYTIADITGRFGYGGIVYLHHDDVKPGDQIKFP